MALSPNSIVTPQTPRAFHVVVVAANANLSDTPTANVLFGVKAGPQGARLTKLTATPRGAVTATELQRFQSLDNAATKHFLGSKLMPAFTPAVTTATVPTDFGFGDQNPLQLGPNEEVWFGIGVAVAAGVVFAGELADF